MARINEKNMVYSQKEYRKHKDVRCSYGFGTDEDGIPYLDLRTGNEFSITGGTSQTVRIPKPELILLLRKMVAERYLKRSDLSDLF